MRTHFDAAFQPARVPPKVVRKRVWDTAEALPAPVFRRILSLPVPPLPVLPAADVSARAAAPCGVARSLVALQVPACASLKAKEDAVRQKFARQWVALAQNVANHSELLRNLVGRADEQLVFLFLDRSGTTLRRHVSGWQRVHVVAGAPGLASVLDFLEALAEGSHSDRGCGRRGRARSVVRAMKFAASKLGLEILHAGLLIQRMWTCDENDQFLLLAFLLMLWGGLRWSDAQRLHFQSLTLDSSSLGLVLADKIFSVGHGLGNCPQHVARSLLGGTKPTLRKCDPLGDRRVRGGKTQSICARESLRGSAWSRCKNPRFFAICDLPA